MKTDFLEIHFSERLLEKIMERIMRKQTSEGHSGQYLLGHFQGFF